MNENQFERLVVAFESLADTMSKWYKSAYPEREPRETVVTRVKTDEDILKEEQGDTGEESLDEWTHLGRHEASFAAKQAMEGGGSEIGSPSKDGD